MANPTLAQNVGLVGMYLRETVLLMAVKAPALEPEMATLAQLMALRANHARQRRVLTEDLKFRWRIRASKYPDLFTPALPH
jgi:hypothetical protein